MYYITLILEMHIIAYYFGYKTRNVNSKKEYRFIEIRIKTQLSPRSSIIIIIRENSKILEIF